MGTRSLTVLKNGAGEEIAVMYRQMDGYPEGHGQDLAEFLTGMEVVNGLSTRQPSKVANGMSCLAAQIIAHFKDDAGGIYLHPAGTRDMGEDYIYTVNLDPTSTTKSLVIKVEDWEGRNYEATPEAYIMWIKTAGGFDYSGEDD